MVNIFPVMLERGFQIAGRKGFGCKSETWVICDMVREEKLACDHPAVVLDGDDFGFSVQVLLRGHCQVASYNSESLVLGGLELKPTCI